MDTILAVPLLTAILEAVKKANIIPGRFIPLTAMVIGAIYTLGTLGGFDFLTILHGFILGLSSVGIYEATKKPIEAGVNKIKKLI